MLDVSRRLTPLVLLVCCALVAAPGCSFTFRLGDTAPDDRQQQDHDDSDDPEPIRLDTDLEPTAAIPVPVVSTSGDWPAGLDGVGLIVFGVVCFALLGLAKAAGSGK